MAHVFISYSKRDRTYARQLADKLREEGFNVWIDDRLDYGEEWWSVIVQAIQDCTAFIVIMSNESKVSKWVKREVGVADHQSKPMFPLLLEGENWDLFVWTQYLDVRGGQLPPADFFDALDNVLPRQPEPGIDVTQSMPAISYPPKEIDDDLGDLELPPTASQPVMSAPTPATIPPPAFALGQGGGGVWVEQPTATRTFPLNLLRRIVGGIVLLMAVLMFFGFFSASWMNIGEDVGDLSAWDIWKGKSGDEAFTLDLSDENATGGFGDVRGMDRLLILVPLGALVLGALAILYIWGRVPLLENLSRRNVAIILAAVALLLFLYPSLWESSSSSNWRATWSTYYGDADYVDHYVTVLEDSYSTGQQSTYGLIALLAGIAAVILEMPRIRGRLGLHE